METSKILWSEGLFLGPQLFQCQDSFHEQRLIAAMRSTHAFPWGVRYQAFANADGETDCVEFTNLDVVLPSGEVLRAPSADALPPPLPLGSVDPDVDTLVLGVTLPAWRHEGENCSNKDRRDRRYAPREARVPDFYASAEEAPVPFASLQPRLVVMSDEHQEGVLPVARLRRGPTGRFRLDGTYIAPSMSLRDSPALHGRLGQLLNILHGKIATLTASEAEPVRDSVAFRAGDHASFWLLHTLGAGAASLGHLKELPVVPPERLFEELLRLAGGLLAFRRSSEHRHLPTYNHRRSDASFCAIFELVGKLVDTVIPTRFVVIPLRQERESYFVGALDEEKLGSDCTFYLAVHATATDHELIATVPRRFKVGAAEDVEKAVTSALPCVPLKHIPHPPPAVPVKPDCIYFVLDRKPAAYKRMREAHAVTVFVPGGVDKVELELLAIHE
ncbi:type VI secretion system baseplate subunit TssK [Luteibacter sp.]|jgi:type VI secretion system protein ImpJ|uniref:type VI secretion system baseplate subunit TssK n=1 Tax=Luteibacter sp. TaxID=1886636 RepID=UPI002F427495